MKVRIVAIEVEGEDLSQIMNQVSALITQATAEQPPRRRRRSRKEMAAAAGPALFEEKSA